MKTIAYALPVALLASTAAADITVLAWPGGDPEVALREVIDLYNQTQGVDDQNEVSIIYFSRQGFKEKMLADAAAGSTEFDVMLTATYDIGRYAPSCCRSTRSSPRTCSRCCRRTQSKPSASRVMSTACRPI